jgi:hypothetical protein
VVRGVPRWLCFDACPTYACLPYVAARAKALTPNAKLVVMVRNEWCLTASCNVCRDKALAGGLHEYMCLTGL